MSNSYPITGIYFNVSFTPPFGDDSIGFSEVAGLSINIEETDQTETTDIPKLILKRGLFPKDDFTQWIIDTLEDQTSDPRDIDIELLNSDGTIGASWHVTSANPVAWYLDPISSTESKIVLETLELTYSKIQRTV